MYIYTHTYKPSFLVFLNTLDTYEDVHATPMRTLRTKKL